MKTQRVVITGVGCVTPLGNSANETWQAIETGRSGIRRVEDFAAFPATVYAPAATRDPERLAGELPAPVRRKLTLPMLLFFAAVREALDNAQLRPLVNTIPIGLIAGTTGNYCVETGVEELLTYYSHAKDNELDWQSYLDNEVYSHDRFFQHTTNLLTCLPAIHFGLKGINQTVHNACASGTQTVGQAYHLIKHGQADVILAGGAEALVTFAGVTALTKLGVLSNQPDPETACRPFDLDRDGLVLGEAAGVLVVESLDSARQRGVPILAEIVGFGSSGNAYRITDSPIDGLGASYAISRCLAEAGIRPEEISAISAHATSTKQNDLSETNAIKLALGEAARQIPVFALKSFLGHSLSAAGAVELVAGVKTVQTGYIPPVNSYRTPDSDCDLNVVTRPIHSESFKYLLKNSFGFGGQNGSLLLKAWQK